MRHASLFSGIGGFDLAAQWMGWENVFNCEWDDFCSDVLRYYFPTTTHYGDIRDIDGTEWKGKIDIITGGFPCQPFSAAGRRRGTDDNRFLWPEMLRVIQEIQPTWVVAENVRGLLTLNEGMVFETVYSDLEANDYEVQPFCIPACAVGASHRRDRIWFIAHSKRGELGKIRNEGKKERSQNSNFIFGDLLGLPWFETATSLCSNDDGLPRELDGITVPKWRRESLKAYGNAVVPQVAYQIFCSIPQTP